MICQVVVVGKESELLKKTEPASTCIDRLSCASAIVTSTTLSYTVSVTQPGTSGSSVNIFSLPDPLIIIVHLYLHCTPQDTPLGRHLHLRMTGHTPLCPFRICHLNLHHNCHKTSAATSPTNGRGKSAVKRFASLQEIFLYPKPPRILVILQPWWCTAV